MILYIIMYIYIYNIYVYIYICIYIYIYIYIYLLRIDTSGWGVNFIYCISLDSQLTTLSIDMIND